MTLVRGHATLYGVRHLLPVRGPLDLALTFGCGQAFRWRAEEGVWSGVVGRAEARLTECGPTEARLSECGPTSLRIDVVGEDPGPAAWGRYLRLDEDPLVHLEGAGELRNLPGFEPLLGLRLLRQEPWETLASFICSAAANIRKITTCVEGLAEALGDPIVGSARRTFPAPAAIARASESDLRGAGLGFRAPYLLETARRLDTKPLAWDALREGPIEEARARLREFPGVGAKIADCVLLFGLDRLDAYPVDRWIRRATLELAGRKRANDRELDAWALRLGPGRGYLQQILFHLRRTGGPFPRLSPARGVNGARSAAGVVENELRDACPDAVGIFAKAPIPGLVKTRLVPPLTNDQAAVVARVSLEETLRRFPPAVRAAWTLFLDGDPEPWLTALAADHGVPVAAQGDGDLGARLARAFRAMHAAGAARAVVIGSDSPTASPAWIAGALELLDDADAVLGPARDGGYWLIGIRPGRGAIFDGIPWSTPDVAAETRRRAAAAGWSLAEAPAWYDLDEPADLARAAADADSCPALSALIASLGL